MRNLPEELYWYETDHPDIRSFSSEQLIDVGNGDAVLDFAYRFLESHSRPPSDDEVHNVTTTIARYKGPAVVQSATLESFLAGLLDMERCG